MHVSPFARWHERAAHTQERVERAMNVSNAGSVLLQTYINKTVQQISLRELGIQATLPRKPGSGDAAYINQRTPGTTGGEWVADTDTGSEETGSYAQASFPYKTLLTRGKVSRRLQATGRTYADILATELTGKSEDFVNVLEAGCATGATTTSANQFNGLFKLCDSSQVVSAGATAGGNDFTLNLLDKTIDRIKGRGNRADLRIYGSAAGLRALNAALQAQQQFTDQNWTEVGAGFRVRTYDGIPIIESTGIPDVLLWNGSNGWSAYVGGTSTALVVVNTRGVWLEELTPMTVMPLAKDNSQYDQFDIYWDGSLVVANKFHLAILGGLKATS
jgi:hypothetical protein